MEIIKEMDHQKNLLHTHKVEEDMVLSFADDETNKKQENKEDEDSELDEDKKVHEDSAVEEDKKEYEGFVRLKQKEYNVKMRMVGNSYAVSIPREIVDFMQEQDVLQSSATNIVINGEEEYYTFKDDFFTPNFLEDGPQNAVKQINKIINPYISQYVSRQFTKFFNEVKF